MNFLSSSRIISDKALCLLRSISNGNRATILANQNRTQHTTTENKDVPIEMDNPYEKERKICILCKHNIEPDYKNIRLLSQFQSRFTGRVYGRHITGLCKAQQEKVEREIHKAQHAGMMAYYNKEIKYVNDPKLFDIDNPFRPHKY